MNSPDPRTRNKVSLSPTPVLPKHTVLSKVLLANALFVLSLHAGKANLLIHDVGIFWLLVRVLACGAVGGMLWIGLAGLSAKKRSMEWPVVGMSSFALFVRYAGLFIALYRLPSTRVVVLASLSSLWLKSVINPTSLYQTCAIGIALCLSFLTDMGVSFENAGHILPAYGALMLEAIASLVFDQTQAVLIPTAGQTLSMAVTVLGAFILSLPLYVFRHILLSHSTPTILPLTSLLTVPLLALSLLFLSPQASHISKTTSPRHFLISNATTLVAAVLFGSVIYSQAFRVSDLVVASLLFYGTFPMYANVQAASLYGSTPRIVRAYIKTILSNPESRKIFYFLMLNMCYMLVQMLYGVWTNSLGLISDAIHMAFDCMAIGVGLIASVMARWEPNERFTYGYGRIETLSGFANGIFLILISIFIVFEAIQRLLDPPEMNTSQLLLVSSLGLGVNLFGMFAMGGHHHHGGHSHSHDHSNGDAVSSAGMSPVLNGDSNSLHSHENSHSHVAEHSHSHSHSDEHSHSVTHSDAHSKPDVHSHSHAADCTQSHLHSDDDGDDSHVNGDHKHSPSPHSHTHSPPASPVHSHSHANGRVTLENHSHSHSLAPAIVLDDEFPPRPSHSHSHSSPVTSTSGRTHLHAAEPHTPPPAGIPAPLHLHARVTSLAYDDNSPMTPNYSFGHDDHFATHHAAAHVPNLHDHSHTHGHSHEGHSHNMRGVFLHVLADTLGSVGVIVSTLLIQLYGWTGFDPIASLFIAVLIAASVVPLVIDTGKVLALDLSDRAEPIKQTLSELPSVEGLTGYSSARFWPKDSDGIIGSVHIQIAPSASSHDPTGPHSTHRTAYSNVERVVERVDSLLRTRIKGLEELTIQVEEG